MDYININGDNNELFVLFHGTGGNEYSLLQKVGDMNANVSIISFSGNVGEGENRRFYAPLINGQVDRVDLNTRVAEFKVLWDSIDKQAEKITFLGFSNGANFILALLEKYPEIADRAVVLHPSDLTYEWNGEHNTEVVMTAGALDPISPASASLALSKQIMSSFPNTTFKLLDGAHVISDKEVEFLKTILF